MILEGKRRLGILISSKIKKGALAFDLACK